ncbi:unnamed protein product [Protopolystoma xenopodis]|uniref:Uncharacterized protein n=1 Tax=Protopolystoma xenopodis TaxID=117903 RepID=A0A3S5CNK4_9PLAT|nr:unnamed protein product [Protopolystoma xenopodis]
MDSEEKDDAKADDTCEPNNIGDNDDCASNSGDKNLKVGGQDDNEQFDGSAGDHGFEEYTEINKFSMVYEEEILRPKKLIKSASLKSLIEFECCRAIGTKIDMFYTRASIRVAIWTLELRPDVEILNRHVCVSNAIICPVRKMTKWNGGGRSQQIAQGQNWICRPVVSRTGSFEEDVRQFGASSSRSSQTSILGVEAEMTTESDCG